MAALGEGTSVLVCCAGLMYFERTKRHARGYSMMAIEVDLAYLKARAKLLTGWIFEVGSVKAAAIV